MMRIDSISSQPDMSGRYKVLFQDGTSIRLYKQTVQDFGLYSGYEMDSDLFESLKQAAAKMSAKMRAVRIISASNVSKRDLEYRLIQKGENPDDAKQAVSWLQDMNLLDDERTAEQLVARCISKGYGIARAKQMLYEKRIPKQYWESVLSDYPEQLDVISSYLDTHLSDPTDQKAVKKVIDALIRKGHSYSSIRKVMELNDPLED